MGAVKIYHVEDTTTNIVAGKRASMYAYDTTLNTYMGYLSDNSTIRYKLTLDTTFTPLYNLGSFTFNDGKFVGLGSSKGRFTFEDDTEDLIKINNAGLSYRDGTDNEVFKISNSDDRIYSELDLDMYEYGATTTSRGITFNKARGSIGSETKLLDGDVFGFVSGYAYWDNGIGSEGLAEFAKIHFETTEDLISTQSDVAIVFSARGSESGALAEIARAYWDTNAAVFEAADKFVCDTVQAGSANGVSLYDDGGNGITVLDGGGVVFVNGDSSGGLPRGEIYTGTNTTATSLAAQDTYYQMLYFTANGDSANCTPEYASGHIKIVKEGVYKVDVSISSYSAQTTEYHYEIFKNDGATGYANLSTRRKTDSSNTPGSVTISGLLELEVNDTVELWVKRTDGGGATKTITLGHVNMTIFQVSGYVAP